MLKLRTPHVTTLVAYVILTLSPLVALGAPGRAVSLRVLQDQARGCVAHAEECTDDVLQLGGLTHVIGYVVDAEERDVILIGKVERGAPAIQLEDFVVALRNSWWKYSEATNDTLFYTSPGCSIDPDPHVVSRLSDVMAESGAKYLNGGSGPFRTDWERTCRSPQNVRVLGIPFDTHFASVMVDADYDLKSIVDGTDDLEISGFTSLGQLSRDRTNLELEEGTHTSENRSTSMNRFELVPGPIGYKSQDGIMIIDECSVILITEEEYLSRAGQMRGRGRPSPNAHLVAAAFTELYPEVSTKRPIFASLENLFRLVALTKIMKLNDAFDEAGLEIDFLLEDFEVPDHFVERTLPGRPCVELVETDVGRAVLSSCGGVGINVQPTSKSIKTLAEPLVEVVLSAVSGQRPSSYSLMWRLWPIFKTTPTWWTRR